ncbi:unnamed protein product, partial [Lymnaea stagnalis]
GSKGHRKYNFLKKKESFGTMRLLPVQYLVSVFLLVLTRTHGKLRTYYLACNEVLYDYAPGWASKLSKYELEEAENFLRPGPNRIGSVYKKAIYFEYTDDTFTTQKPKPAKHGILGPIMKAEVGDVMHVHFFNNCSREYSIHPHGVFYLKSSEGALYLDGIADDQKRNDRVPAGDKTVYEWNVTESDAPTEDDPACLPWAYHSHVNSIKDVFSGLFGLIITCKRGVLDANNKRKDVDVELPLLDMIWDENMSWYLDDNVEMFCQDRDRCRQVNEDGDPDFIDSNLKRSLNGRSFGTLAGLEVCVGDRVQFYVIGFGNEMDVHSLHFHGQNLQFQHQRGDTVSVYTATFVGAQTTPTNAGSWRITDMVGDFEKKGTWAAYQVKDCKTNQPPRRRPATTRQYYLAVEETDWDYAPSGRDLRTGQPLDLPSSQTSPGGYNPRNRRSIHPHMRSHNQWRHRSSFGRMHGFLNWYRIHQSRHPDFYRRRSRNVLYKKARFVQYKSQAFRARVPQTRQEEHLGILGPVLKVELGDRLIVTLKNTIPFPVSFLPHGLSYDVTQEATGGPGVSGGSVQTNQVYTYTFDVPDNLLDDTNQPCKNYLYTSAHDPTRDHNTGLVGPLLVCRKGYLDSRAVRNIHEFESDIFQAKPKEFYLLLSTIDESSSLYAPPNQSTDSEDDLSNRKFSINGYVYGNLPGLSMSEGEDIVWYVMSVGSELDVHTVTFDGNTFDEAGSRRDGRSLVPGVTAALSMRPDNIGRWMVYSDSTLARENGMFAFYTVAESGGRDWRRGPKSNGVTRNYYISADEVLWNYAPKPRALVTGDNLTDPDVDGSIFVRQDDMFIGQIYKKVIYRGYTDSSFRSPVESPGDILGPALIAEVGDTIRVTFRNNASRPYSIHSHGLQTSGLDYGTGRGVEPGQTYVYVWKIPERSGPGPKDPNCIPWLYSSYVDPLKDKNSGLAGALVVCRSHLVPHPTGVLDDYNKRKDVDVELPLLDMNWDENMSWYLDENINLYCQVPDLCRHLNNISDPDFIDSNLKRSLNGKSFGTLPGLEACVGDRVQFYVVGFGNEMDVHSLHFHGQNLQFQHQRGIRRDVRNLVPGVTATLTMQPDNLGKWMVYSGSAFARENGMFAFYTVSDCGNGYPQRDQGPAGVLRNYYLSADEVIWDFAPLTRAIVTGEDLNDPNVDGSIFVRHDDLFIGHLYKKVIYRGYTDSTFSYPIESPGDILGPALIAEVGDTIKVTFRNNASRPYSIHSHGVQTSQASSGVDYGDAGGVAPGQVVTYIWRIPERSGPGPKDPNCIPWLYSSYVDPLKDKNSGLAGALVICRPGTLDSNGRRKDVDREKYIYMSVLDENESWYLDENVRLYAPGRVGTDYRNDKDFIESNKKHTINGRLYGNNNNLVMEYGERIVWYMMGLGAQIDLHTIHLHGHTFIHSSEKHRDDVIYVFPGMAEAVEMTADNPGTWLLHCHVMDHIFAGMETVYTV